MGVYIKGLTEEQFKLVLSEYIYTALKRQDRIIEVQEPHGRLIDADAIDTSYSDPEVVETLNDASTIIEAEGE